MKPYFDLGPLGPFASIPKEAKAVTTEIIKYGIEYWHPYFKWMPWEPGDKEYTKAEADQLLRIEKGHGARIRMKPVNVEGVK